MKNGEECKDPKGKWKGPGQQQTPVISRIWDILVQTSRGEKYKEVQVHHIVDSTFDHFALLVSDSFTPRHPRKRQFHFEAMQIKKRECKDIIETAWENSRNQDTPCGMAERLNQCAAELNRWNLATFGKVPKQIGPKKKKKGS